MEEQRARQIVRHALALRVLLPEDVAATGKPPEDPLGMLIELQRRSLLTPEVVDALGELAEAERPSAKRRAPARLVVGAGPASSEGDTLAPEREEGSDTLAPEREDESFRLPGSLKNEFQAAASFLLDQDPQTLAPEREGEGLAIAAGGDEAGGTLAGLGSAGLGSGQGTLAGSGLGTLAGLESGGGTLEGGEGELSLGTLAGLAAAEAGTLAGGDPGGTAGGADGGTAGGADEGPSSTIAGPPSGLGRAVPDLPDPVQVKPRKLDLGLVSEKVRRDLEEAALARAVVQQGKAASKKVLEAVKRARQRKVLLREQLIQDGLLDQTGLKALTRELQGLQRVCGACLATFAPDAAPDAPCPACGHVTLAGSEPAAGGTGDGTGTGTGTAAGRDEADLTGEGTIASSTGGTAQTVQKTSPKGIEGFPGEGGTFANYELIKRVAEGGMGVVFKARERTLNRIVALKVMRGGALASKVRRRRFLAEAESAAGLHHPSIVPIHQISEVAGYPFYTMDFVDGRPLDDWVKRNDAAPAQVANLMRAVADAVHHFHLRGIIHRDLKPDNILVTDEGEPKIIDFGIAKKITSELDTDASWTVEGEVLGTPHYMPPEQAAGRVQEVDTRSDVYALGAILYKLLAGKPPFAGLPVARVVLAIQDDDPTPLSSLNTTLDRDLEAIVGKAMAKERERRYQSALELAQDLQRFLDHEPVQARPASFGYRARKFVRKHRAAVTATAFVAGLLLAALVWQVGAARARARQVALLMDDARRAPLEKRPELFSLVLGQDPGNALAAAEKDKAESQLRAEAEARRAEEQARRAEDEKRLADERVKAEQAQAALAAELQQREMREMQARERAREEAEEKARQEATRRAGSLLARAEESQDPLTAVGLLTDALALVPEQEHDPLSVRLAGRKVDLSLRLCREALDQNQGGLAAYWLQEARKLNASLPRQEELEQLEERIQYLQSGLLLLDEARALIRAERWLLARDKLRQAAARGVSPDALSDDAALVRLRCAAEGRRLLDQGRASLNEGRPEQALSSARSALDYLEEGEQAPARELIEACAQSAAQVARLQAWRLFQRPETRGEALEVLQQAARTVEGTPYQALLLRERDHRARLVNERALEGLVYLPELRELQLEPCFLGRTEVTNEEFKAFVDAGGYQDDAWWDPEALPLRRGFLDATPGARQPGPRTWRQGSYGDAANAVRPVTGVTWWEARAFARWRSQRSGQRWRLPTRLEWEAAAGWSPETRRLGAYPWGDEFAAGALVCAASTPSPVGSAPQDRSPLGALDLGGNVSEWVEAGVPARPALKGASYAVAPAVARHLASVETVGRPDAAPPAELLSAIGFRLVLEPDR